MAGSGKHRLARCVEGRGVTLIRKLYEGAPADCINLGLGQPTDPIPVEARDAAASVLARGLVQYTPTAGLSHLRSAVGQRVYEGAPPESVLITSGSQEALWVSVMGLVNPGEDVLFPEPGYPAYRAVTEMVGARPVPVPITFEGRWRLDPEAVLRAWTPNTRLVILGSPANPTGMSAGSNTDMARLYRTCVERDAYLLVDEIYAPITFHQTHGPLHRLGDRVISVSGVSKAFSCTGFRVGWIFAHPDVIRGLMPLHQQVALCAPTVGQHAALACMTLWGEEHFGRLRALYAKRRDAALEALDEIEGVRFHDPDGSFYVMTDVSSYAKDTFALAMRVRDEAHVITAPGEAFGPGGEGYLRISFATEPARIREGIERLGRILQRPRA